MSPVKLLPTQSPWVSALGKAHGARLNLICFHYSGGSAQVYLPWRDKLPSHVQIYGITLPGRGARFGDPLITDPEQVSAALVRELPAFMDRPTAFFGHSLGAAFAFETALRLQAMGKGPKTVFVSGRNAPHRPRMQEPIHALPEAQFKVKLLEYGGVPPEVVAHAELMELVLPITRADFTLSETYTHRPGVKLESELVAFGGQDDHITNVEGIEAWREHAAGPFSCHILPGEHFFINTAMDDLMAKIKQHLIKIM